ncbi:MAG: hypothetical protein M3065_22670 [Actinomycetota bacterium]|nr:hypothetical protein [Actinomycetota bacterium]
MPKLVSLLALGVLAITGCGSSRSASSASSPGGAPTATGSAATLLKKATPRPPGVSEQFNYAGAAGPGPCFNPTGPTQVRFRPEPFYSNPGRPRDLKIVPGVASFGEPADICFNGFGQGPVHVDVLGPNGYRIAGVLSRLPGRDHYSIGWQPYDWVPAFDSSWPLGRYTLSATAGSQHASTSFSLIQPVETGLRVLGPSTDPGHNTMPPDSFAQVFLAGFPGSRAVRLVTYRQGPRAGPASYFSSAEVPMPPTGETIVPIRTGHPDPNTTFIVTTRSAGVTLFGAFNVLGSSSDASIVVGPLPTQ